MRTSTLCLAVLALLAASALAANDFVNTKVKRKIELTTHLVKTRTSITAKALGDGKGTYTVSFPDEEAAQIAFLQVKADDSVLKVEKQASSNGITSYTVELKKILAKDETASIEVTTVRSHALVPKPAEISQKEQQLVLFTTQQYLTTPYTTKKQETILSLPSSSVSSYTKAEPFSLSGSTLSYGPYADVKPAAAGTITVHFTSNTPFATFTEVIKEIEVSHWGNIAVEEQIDLTHTGAKLKGGFSRLDYQMTMAPNPSFRALTAQLPSSARDIYYRDIIGNISTSHVRFGNDAVVFEIETRFPMFGGWHTQWYQGYNVPSRTYLKSDGNSFLLKVPFGVPFSQVVTDKISVKVILPEDSTVTSVVVPAALTQGADEKRFTYLDTPNAGRPVLTFTGSNVIDENNGFIEVSYTTAPASIVREPFMLVSAFLALFIGYMVISRVNLSVS